MRGSSPARALQAAAIRMRIPSRVMRRRRGNAIARMPAMPSCIFTAAQIAKRPPIEWPTRSNFSCCARKAVSSDATCASQARRPVRRNCRSDPPCPGKEIVCVCTPHASASAANGAKCAGLPRKPWSITAHMPLFSSGFAWASPCTPFTAARGVPPELHASTRVTG